MGSTRITLKHEAAERIATREVPTIVLHVGDFDPSGEHVFTSAAEDVGAWVEHLTGSGGDLFDLFVAFGGGGGSTEWVTFERVAVTPEQIDEYGLDTQPRKAPRKGEPSFSGEETCQAEALAPDDLAEIVREAVQIHIDPLVFDRVLADEETERALLVDEAERFGT